MTTALQRKLSFGALDFSPLHHSPALAERHYYTKNRSEWSGEILANITRGKSAAMKIHSPKRRQDGISTKAVGRAAQAGTSVARSQLARCVVGMRFLPQGSRRAERWSKRSGEAGEPTGAREQVCGPGVILTADVKGAREGARVKIMLVGCPQTAGRASRSGEGLTIGRRGDFQP